MTEGMRKFQPIDWTVAVILALLLAACGGSGSDGDVSTAPIPVAQKGFGPTQLYHPSANPNGRVLQEGDTGIVFMQQAGIGGVGEQQVWFEIADGSTYAIEMEDEDLALLSRVELTDVAGRLQLSVDADHRFGSTSLAPGRYVLRLFASSTNFVATPLFIHFEHAPVPAAKLATIGKLTPPDGLMFGNLMMGRVCVGCDLSGVHLQGQPMKAGDLRGAHLRGADLSDADLSGVDLSGANLSFAKLNGANLSSANLSDTNLFAAILINAKLIGAKLNGARLIGANLIDAVWVDGRKCGASSGEGECR